MKTLNVEDQLRSILNVPNKNALYRDLGLNYTYLNLKNFINGKEPLKQKSLEFISKKLNITPIMLFIGGEDDFLNEEEKQVLEKIQKKFLDRVSEYTKQFENDFRKPKKIKLTDEQKEESSKIFNEFMVDLNIDDLEHIHY